MRNLACALSLITGLALVVIIMGGASRNGLAEPLAAALLFAWATTWIVVVDERGEDTPITPDPGDRAHRVVFRAQGIVSFLSLLTAIAVVSGPTGLIPLDAHDLLDDFVAALLLYWAFTWVFPKLRSRS